MSKPYRLFDHTADLGIEVSGKTRADLFANAAFALFDLLVDLDGIQQTEERTIAIQGSDETDLFVNYLREILYLFNGEGLILPHSDIGAISRRQLTARLRGERYNPSVHRVKMEIKAVTYHQAAVRRTDGGWQGRVILDV
jgi:SHS2 domain-containing protein